MSLRRSKLPGRRGRRRGCGAPAGFRRYLRRALAEAGDLRQALERGLISCDCIEREPSELVSGRATGRRGADEIILFKTLGTAIEDLATAKLIVAAAGEPSPGDKT